MAAYIASKHAAVAISESLALEVEGTAMGVTVLCPGGVATGIYRAEAERRAAAGLSAPDDTQALFERMAAPDRADQATPERIAAAALEAIRAGHLYAVVNADIHQDAVRRRHRRIEGAMGIADGG
jgi:short-subunit dehydrogenase